MNSDSFTAGTEPPEPTPAEERISDESKQRRIQKVWLARLSNERKAHKDYRDDARKVAKNYEDDCDGLYVPLYWSVIKTQMSGLYSNSPTPDVRPANETWNPVYRNISLLIQRGLGRIVDKQGFDFNIKRSIKDYLGVSLGVPRVKIDSIINTTTFTVPITDAWGRQVGSRQETEESIGDQTIRWEYVPWRRFGWEPCNSWKECSWIYFRHRMTQRDIKKRFGKMVKASKDDKDNTSDNDWKRKTFDIYEIWDKEARKVLFIAKGEPIPLEIHDDPLNLIDFWPCPQPMMNNLPSEELIPVPDYNFIESYDRELNRLYERRAELTEQIKASGAYDSSFPELGEMLNNDDGEFKPIQNLLARLSTSGGSMDQALHYLPIMEKIQALEVIDKQIMGVKASVDEILGISDIVRGVTQASESATAQEIKGRWVGIRLTDKRETVQYTVREMLRITAQLLASHITPQNLSRMTQMEITEEMQQILSNDLLMEFLIDIETDSTIAKDEAKEQQTHQEMLNGVAQYSQSVLPAVQQGQMPADTASAILRSAMKPYARYDRGLEESLNSLPQTMQQLQQLTQQLQQAQQESQQAQQQAQQWQSIAQQLQALATESVAAKNNAEAKKKLAEADLTKEKLFTEHEKHGSHPKIGLPTDDMASKAIEEYDAETRRLAVEVQRANGQKPN